MPVFCGTQCVFGDWFRFSFLEMTPGLSLHGFQSYALWQKMSMNSASWGYCNINQPMFEEWNLKMMTSFKELQPFSFRMEQSVFLYSNKCSKPWKILSTRITRELREHDFVEENPSTLSFQPFGHSASRKRCFEPTCLWNTDSVLQFSTYCIYSGWNINLALFPINLTSENLLIFQRSQKNHTRPFKMLIF